MNARRNRIENLTPAPQADCDDAEPPVVEVTRTRAHDRTPLLIVCPFCGERHVHGAVSERFGAGNGLRRSHFFTVAPRAYVLREVATAPNDAEEAR